MAAATTDDGPIRDQLLRAAAELVAEHGADALTTRKLATAVGTSTMAVYTHFGSMPNVMKALYREAFGRFGQELARAPHSDDALADLEALAHAYRHFALENPNFYEIMFGHRAPAFVPDQEDQAFALATFDILVDAIQRCVDDGLLPGPALSAGFQTWSALHGAVSLELVMPREIMATFSSGEVFEQLVRTVLDGLRIPAPSS